jgi:hypothetical protein
MREAQVNLAIRWFAGFGLNESLPNHSSLSRIRQRWGPALFQRIFERSVEACVAAKLVGGDMLHVDATLIRADVSWSSLAREYVAAVDEANDDGDPGAGPASPPTGKSAKGKFKKISRTDRDARMATNKYNQRLEPCYKQHTGMDAKCGVQVDASVSRADVHEGKALIGQVERVQALVGKKLSVVTADKGYASAANFAAIEARGLRAVIPPVRTRPAKVPLSRFKYDARHDLLRCPKGKHLHRGTKTAKGAVYRSKAVDCKGCALASDCLSGKTSARSVTLTDGYPALLRARRRYRRKLASDRAAYHAHRFRVEGVHGEAKTWHGLNRATRRGLTNMRIQAWLTAAAINLKRLAKAFCALHWPYQAGFYARLRWLAAILAKSQPILLKRTTQCTAL